MRKNWATHRDGDEDQQDVQVCIKSESNAASKMCALYSQDDVQKFQMLLNTVGSATIFFEGLNISAVLSLICDSVDPLVV
jgi:hypothetical protein